VCWLGQPKKVLIAYGEPVTENGQAFKRRAFRWLVGQ
jgi:hypothetical protein